MKPTPEMIEEACIAYNACDSMSMTACMSAALEAALSAMWQPIETAPKDEYVLAFEDGEFYKARYDSAEEYWQSCCGQPVVYDPQPTHWMPLPQPPEAS